MSYKVIRYFTDLQDFNHPYHVGDIFPRAGMKVSEKRLDELSTNKNKQGIPLIVLEKEKVEKVVEVKKSDYTKTDINRMPLVELKELAKSEGIENSEEMSGGELKKVLISWFDL